MERGGLTVGFTEKMLIDFLNKLSDFDRDNRAAIEAASCMIRDQDKYERNDRTKAVTSAEQNSMNHTSKMGRIIDDYHTRIDNAISIDIDRKSSTFLRLQKCKEKLSLIMSAENSITNKAAYSDKSMNATVYSGLSINSILEGKIDFIAKAYDVNETLLNPNEDDNKNVCSSFYSLCRAAEHLLNEEIITLRSSIVQNIDELHQNYRNTGVNTRQKVDSNLSSINDGLSEISHAFASLRDSSRKETERVSLSSEDTLKQEQNKLIDRFCEQFPPKEMAAEYSNLYALEPVFDDYKCFDKMPRSAHISSLVYDISSLGLSDYTKSFLNRYYPYMYKGNTIAIPFCTYFGSEFNYLFRFNGEGYQRVVKDACDLGMRLFMMVPPGKLNFTFIDPVASGGSFAMFTRLIDVNDNKREIINGKIWSNPSDIEEKLRVMTDHIANVIQRCLQGKYDSIYEYNRDAEQNAEAYQIIMLMDFPAGLTDQSLKLLEQIVTSGPKCGVFTILYRNESQFKKMSERSYPLVSNIEKNFQLFDYSETCTEVTYSGERVKERLLQWKGLSLPSQSQMDIIIEKLKLGIKNAEKIVINFDKIIPPKEEWFKGDSTGEFSIPIGVHGANNIQNLSFGIGGSHHALVAGQTGSGKSSLLHTIIMSALIKYPANQLQVFLVDFKRGVEFKIYANYSLENFKVIAIESEREFGRSVLEYLDKEQSRRAERFKKLNVDNVGDYRKKSGESLPRILLIIDEFHVLFSKDTSDINSKNSAAYLEQLIRQGRAFGIHVILASQTMSNMGGINYGVWGQIGVRIALKCPKSDAKFVLGSDNDGVDLLSADNPGQAIYNSDCGNAVANTVFRVAYIEQDEQDKYLKYISEKEPRFNYPTTRVMLSNVEDNIYNPLQRFARGENYNFTENALLVGEPLKIINNMKMVFKQKQGSNMLVIGNDEQKARTLFTFAVLSLSLHALTKNSYHCPESQKIYLFDYAPLEVFEDRDDTLLTLAKKLPNYVKYIPFDESEEAMIELYKVFKQREKGTEQNDELYMMVYGLQRARSLRSSDIYKKNVRIEEFDEFGENAYLESRGLSSQEHLNVKPYDIFLHLLQRGAPYGVNAIIWEDNFKLFMNSYADMLPNFDMRIAFTMPDEDSINFIEAVDGSKIGENGAIYNYNGNQKFRPYKQPDSEWLETICTRINQF